jgi:menaquinone-dependent protoporphyrinogen IX oxidase
MPTGMITYKKLKAHPQAANSVIGMSLKAFHELFKEFAEAHQERLEQETKAHYSGKPRQRAYGGGRKPKYDLRD